MQIALSSTGIQKVRAAAQKKLTSCVKQRSLKPAGCGFSTYLPKGNKPRASTIRWRILKGANAMKSSSRASTSATRRRCGRPPTSNCGST